MPTLAELIEQHAPEPLGFTTVVGVDLPPEEPIQSEEESEQ